MNHLFLEITLVVALATALGTVATWLKQPTIVGYIATGLVVGPLGLMRLNNPEVLDAMAQFGIAFLLFLVGMEMNFAELKHVGKSVLLIGLGQVVFTSIVGFLIALGLGFAPIAAVYIGVLLTFSSTIIVVKLLSEKRALESLYGKIVVGVLLVQDFFALGLLILLSGLSHGAAPGGGLPVDELVRTFAKGAVFLVAALASGRWILPRFFRLIGGSSEIMFLTSLTWGLGLAALAALPQIGLTIEIGSFLAGVALAGSVEHFQIMSRVKALRDFFVVMFFILLGSRMTLEAGPGVWVPAAVLSLFVLIGNPLIVLLLMSGLGYGARVSFLAGLTVAQISEFSLIAVALGHRLGHVGKDVVSIVTAVGLVTITVSSYLILYGERLFEVMKPALKVFGRGRRHVQEPHGLKSHVVLVGCHRMGHNLVHSLEDMHKEFVAVDFNPDVVRRLHARGLRAYYGDISDPDIQELAGIDDARLIVSTVPSLEDSLSLIERARRGGRARVIVTAESEYDAMRLYEAGADYVMLPHFIGGLQLARIIESDRTLRTLAKLREQDLATIVNHP